MARVRRSSFTLAPCGEPVGEGQTTNGPGGDGGGGGQGDERNQPSPTGTQSPLQAQEEQLRSRIAARKERAFDAEMDSNENSPAQQGGLRGGPGGGGDSGLAPSASAVKDLIALRKEAEKEAEKELQHRAVSKEDTAGRAGGGGGRQDSGGLGVLAARRASETSRDKARPPDKEIDHDKKEILRQRIEQRRRTSGGTPTAASGPRPGFNLGDSSKDSSSSAGVRAPATSKTPPRTRSPRRRATSPRRETTPAAWAALGRATSPRSSPRPLNSFGSSSSAAASPRAVAAAPPLGSSGTSQQRGPAKREGSFNSTSRAKAGSPRRLTKNESDGSFERRGPPFLATPPIANPTPPRGRRTLAERRAEEATRTASSSTAASATDLKLAEGKAAEGKAGSGAEGKAEGKVEKRKTKARAPTPGRSTWGGMRPTSPFRGGRPAPEKDHAVA